MGFFNDENPFKTKISEDQKQLCEGELTEQECLKALKNMKNMKSPGNDGFTTEFYKLFWLDAKKILVESFNESYSELKNYISQRQGIITCIPKEEKSKYSLKNWRLITLLNIDLKICSAAISNRLNPVLVNLISQTQKAFLRGRYIEECTRLIIDLNRKNGRG